jgi:hypothetical protein
MLYNDFYRKNNSFIVRLAVVVFSNYNFKLLLAIPVNRERGV